MQQVQQVRYGVFLRPDPQTCAAVTTITGQVAGVDEALSSTRPLPVINSGVSPVGQVIVYDVHSLDGQPNAALVELAGSVDEAVRPLSAAPPDGSLPADVSEPGRWHGHLSLASHDLYPRADLHDEVLDYIGGLVVPCPPRFEADVIALYRFEHPDWTGAWWTELAWSHVHSWWLDR